MEKREPSYAVGGNVIWCSHYREQYEGSPGESHNLKRYVHPNVHCSTTARTRKQPKCPSTEEWIKMWYINTMEYYLALKKNKIMPFAATWMDLEIVILSKVSQTEKDK